jgi:hypothetical protein
MYKATFFVNSPLDKSKKDLIEALEERGIAEYCEVYAFLRKVEVQVKHYAVSLVGATFTKASVSLKYFKITFYDEKAHLLFRLAFIDDMTYKICNPDIDMKAFDGRDFEIISYYDIELD